MEQMRIADTTLCVEKNVIGFKEKLEIARHLEKLKVDVIELPEIENEKADILFVRTASSFVKNAVLSVAAGSTMQSVVNAVAALSQAKKGRVRLELPVSPAGMEYFCRKKPDAMLAWISEAVRTAKNQVSQVEFCAVDATRAEPEFLSAAIAAAVEAGATHIAVCDSTAEILCDDFAKTVRGVLESTSLPVSVSCNNKNGMAVASSLLAVRCGADCVKTDVGGQLAPLDTVASLIKDCGRRYDISVAIRQTELYRTVKQIRWLLGNAKNEKAAMTVSGGEDETIRLDQKDDQTDVEIAVAKLGYDLSEEDKKRVYEEFLRVAAKKNVGSKELDAIVASVAMQVPATYRLESYVVNNGNIISSTAQICLSKGENLLSAVCLGDGPVDAAFRAIDQIIGHHYELDDFQIQSVTEGKEAMGSALVKLRAGGKVYSGNGISTDIIGAGIRAYLSAVNKIIYEEA